MTKTEIEVTVKWGSGFAGLSVPFWMPDHAVIAQVRKKLPWADLSSAKVERP